MLVYFAMDGLIVMMLGPAAKSCHGPGVDEYVRWVDGDWAGGPGINFGVNNSGTSVPNNLNLDLGKNVDAPFFMQLLT